MITTNKARTRTSCIYSRVYLLLRTNESVHVKKLVPVGKMSVLKMSLLSLLSLTIGFGLGLGIFALVKPDPPPHIAADNPGMLNIN